MNPRFALAIPKAEAPALGRLRRWKGVEVCEHAALVWVRAAEFDDRQWDECRRVPNADRYTVTDDGRLLAVGNLVPCGILPAGPWRPIAGWLELSLPPHDDAAPLPAPASVHLVRSTVEREARWLLTDLDTWCDYAATAPQTRLTGLSFVADRTGAVVIRGTPLPPIPGVRLLETDGIAVPAGYAWQPAVGATILREAFQLDQDDAVLWTSDGLRRRIAAGDWVRAGRSAAALTRERLRKGAAP